MNNLLSLYYFELEKNKKKFYLISIFVVLIFLAITSIFFLKGEFGGSEFQGIKYLKIFFSGSSELSGSKLYNALLLNNMYLYGFDFLGKVLVSLGALFAVIMSFDIVSRDYRRNNKSIYIYSVMPVKIWKLKLAKVLCGLTLYMFYIVLVCIGIFVMNGILKLFGGKYISDIYPYVSDLIVYMPTNPLNTAFITFVFVPTCIIGIQFICNFTCFLDDVKNKYIVKKILSYIIITIMGILMLLYLFVFWMTSDFGFVFGASIFNIDLLEVGFIVLVTMSIAMFVIDCRITKKRLRGGLNVKKS